MPHSPASPCPTRPASRFMKRAGLKRSGSGGRPVGSLTIGSTWVGGKRFLPRQTHPSTTAERRTPYNDYLAGTIAPAGEGGGGAPQLQVQIAPGSCWRRPPPKRGWTQQRIAMRLVGHRAGERDGSVAAEGFRWWRRPRDRTRRNDRCPRAEPAFPEVGPNPGSGRPPSGGTDNAYIQPCPASPNTSLPSHTRGAAPELDWDGAPPPDPIPPGAPG